MLILVFIILCRADLSGIEYSSDGKVLIGTPSDLKEAIIQKNCEIINGGDSVLTSSFSKCINSITKISFEEGSQLKCIFPFVFSTSTLVDVDMTNCIYLYSLNYSVFKSCNKITRIILPEGMKVIYAGSLSGLSSLKSLKLPDSLVQIIGYTDGYGGSINSPITEVIVSEKSNLVTIGSDCFYSTLLTSFYIPRNLSSISSSFFGSRISSFTIHPENKNFRFHDNLLLSYDNTTIKYFAYKPGFNFVIPSYVKTLDPSACRSNPLSSITFEGTMSSLSQFSFAASTLVNISFPEGLIHVPGFCFEYATKLKSVTLSKTIKYIDAYAFRGCTALSSININEGIISIGNEAFKNANSLTTFKCPQSLAGFGDGVFSGCTNLNFDPNGNKLFSIIDKVLYVEGSKAKEFFGDSGSIEIPEYCTAITSGIFYNKGINKITIKSNKSLTIGESAFYGTKIASIQFPSCISSFGKSSFAYITTLKTVTIPSSSLLKVIPESCFCGCTQLTSITLPTCLETIGITAFYNCQKLSTINFASTSIKEIGKHAFAYSGVTLLSFPSNLATIGEQCFLSSSLSTITMVFNSLSTITPALFKNCKSLSTVSLSDSILSISSYSFSHCTSLTHITLPQKIQFIEPNAFEYCSLLEVVGIPLNCELQIRGQAFTGCPKLEKFDVMEEDQNFVFESGILMNKARTELVVFLPSSRKTIYVVPATIENIGNYAFQGCNNLRTIIIPEGRIKNVGYMSFEGCTSLSSLYLPSSLNGFGENAFKNCKNLKCGSVLFENEDKQNAINAGIPEIAFATECGNINQCTHKLCKCSLIRSSAILLLSIIST